MQLEVKVFRCLQYGSLFCYLYFQQTNTVRELGYRKNYLYLWSSQLHAYYFNA